MTVKGSYSSNIRSGAACSRHLYSLAGANPLFFCEQCGEEFCPCCVRDGAWQEFEIAGWSVHWYRCPRCSIGLAFIMSPSPGYPGMGPSMSNETSVGPTPPAVTAVPESGNENARIIATPPQPAPEKKDDDYWKTRIPWILTGVSIFVAACSLIVSSFSYNATVKYSSSQARMQFLREIYGEYSDFSVKRVDYWYLTHLFVVPEADGGYAEYDRAVQSVREAVSKEPLPKRLEYQLKEEALVTLILTKYEQGLYQLEEANRIGDEWLRTFLKEEVVDYFRKNLIRNPRVLYYWDDVKQLFSEKLRQDVAKQLEGTSSLRRDKIGPFIPPSRPQAGNNFKELNDDFRDNYRTAKELVLKQTPYVIVVEGDDIVLLHSGQRSFERFTPKIYHSLKSVAHLPLSVFVILSGHVDRTLPESVIAGLARTRQFIRSARERSKEKGFSEPQLDRQLKILDATDQLIGQAIDTMNIGQGSLDTYVKGMRPLIMANTEEAARSQLDGLHAVIEKWSNEHGEGLLKQVHVVVMGPQAPRRGNLALQYFARLLNVGGECPRLLYSESIFDEGKAVDLLGTRLLDDTASEAFFGNKDRLQTDLLAEAAERYIPKLFPK